MSTALLSMLAAGFPGVVSADVFPPATTSWYVTNYTTSDWYSRGCALGTAAYQNWLNGSTNLQHTLVIMDFGTEVLSGSTWGADWTDLDGVFHPYTAVQAVIDAYAQGFWVCTQTDATARVTIGAGTRNIFWPGATRATEGLAWSQLVTTFQNSLGQYASQASVWGAIDAEPAWSTASDAIAWATAYNNNSGRQPYCDYGSADGCPPFGSCNYSWSQASEYAMAWGITAAWAVPEVYSQQGENATQWQRISLWGVTTGQPTGKILFAAPMSQWNSCDSNPKRRADCTNKKIFNSPLDAWTQLTNAVQSDSRTSVSISRATDINWH